MDSNNIRHVALAALLAASALPAGSALAQDDSPPLPGGVKCTYTVKKKVKLRTALKGGVPVKVTCSGPASLGASASLEGRRVGNYIAEHYGGGHPGEGFVAPPRKVGEGTHTIRMKVRPFARKIAKRFAPFPIHTGLATKRVDGGYHGFSVKKTRIVR